MITMIIGVITIVALLVTRLPDGTATHLATPPLLPDSLTLPGGLVAEAVTAGKGWFAVITTDQQILIFDAKGQLVQQLQISGLQSGED